MTIQAPVQYRVTTSPTRAGNYPAPYTLINLSTEHTAWIANNAGLQIGQGTPLYPGTSLSWTQEGELWVVGSGEFDVLVSYDVVDWEPNPAAIATAILNSGMLMVDNPEVLYDSPVFSSGTVATLDISRFQSISVNIGVTTAGAHALDEISFRFRDSDSSSNMAVYPLNFRNVSFSPDVFNGAWQGTFPAIADTLEIVIGNMDAAILTFEIVGSYRPTDTIRQSVQPFGFATDFVCAPIPQVAPSTLEYQLPPWYGEIEIDLNLIGGNAGDPIPYVAVYAGTASNGNQIVTHLTFEEHVISATTTLIHGSRTIISNGDAIRMRLVIPMAFTFRGNPCQLRITPKTGI